MDQTRGTRARSAPPRGSRSSARGARPIQRVCGWKREQEAHAPRLHLLKSNNTYKNHINHIISYQINGYDINKRDARRVEGTVLVRYTYQD